MWSINQGGRLFMMLSRSRRATWVLAITVGAVAAFSAVAEAGDRGSDTRNPEVFIPEGSVLATPDEVALMGGTAAEIAAQQTAWDALPAHVAREQRELNASEHELYEAAFDNIVEPTLSWGTEPDSPETIAPMVIQTPCNYIYYESYYKITSDRQGMQCFAGSVGTYYLNPTFSDAGSTSIRLQPAAYKGRVYYKIWTYLYWSTTHGPNDYTWYKFEIGYDKTIEVLRVQFVA